MTLNVCRICLDGNVKMHCIDHKLLEIYEKLSSSKMNIEDGLPTTICYICVSQLQRCRRFFDMARESIKTLTHRIQSGLWVTSINATSENLGETHHLTVTTIAHMTVKHVEDSQPSEYEDLFEIEESRLDDVDVARSENITHNTAKHVEDCQVKVKQERVAVKEDPDEYEDLLDIEESRLDDVDVGSCENITHMTVKHVVDCQVKVKQEQVAVKEETAEYENLLDIEESRHDDVDVASSKDIEQHLLKESRDQKQYFYCDICNTKCISKSNLIRHMKTHTGYKPYACDICKKTFIRGSHLKRHMRIHTGEKPYACDICKKTFKQTEHLKRHLLIHTGESPYTCDICNKGFNRPGNLKIHMLIHTGEKPYACHICRKAFKQAQNLKKHMLGSHTREKLECNLCNKVFVRAGNFKNHMFIHTH